MSNDNLNIENMGDIITGLFHNISVEDVEKGNNLAKSLNKVLCSIKSYDEEKFPNQGEKLAAHTKIVDLKNGILILETNHPGWIQLLQIYQKYILTGLKRDCPDVEIKNLAFKLSGNKDNVFDTKTYAAKDVYKNQIKNDKELQKSLKKQEELIEKNTPKRENKEIPAEIKKLFENLI